MYFIPFRLDEINSTLNNSERHLNGIKSVFGGIRNYLFAEKNGIATTTSPAYAESSLVVPVSINDQPTVLPKSKRSSMTALKRVLCTMLQSTNIFRQRQLNDFCLSRVAQFSDQEII